MLDNPIMVVGGTMKFSDLKSTDNPKEYSIGKAFVWLAMLKKKQVPIKWYKPNKAGTKVDFILPRKQEEWDESYDSLKKFLVSTNSMYGTDLELTKEEQPHDNDTQTP
ncbi:hypothetical protein H7B90_23745 [Cohnella xylanilytica]|uniref:Uncharacterized protein n=1 Tax=Cohnella xylanilytica TaxID=557555 RepID=A0A841U1K5_9BACL|nr:hypothetical protein [Cohnella xylanilytica]MBB6694415.1 hypothetical protein [Cohnella xylanilytica]